MTQAKLEYTFSSRLGAAAFTTIDALNAQAEALAKATTFDDEGSRLLRLRCSTFGNITGESFTRATEAAADMAAFLGTDIAGCSELLGKALNDPVKGMAAWLRQAVILH